MRLKGLVPILALASDGPAPNTINNISVEYKQPVSDKKRKEAAKGEPSWAKGERPLSPEMESSLLKCLLKSALSQSGNKKE